LQTVAETCSGLSPKQRVNNFFAAEFTRTLDITWKGGDEGSHKDG